MTAYIDKAVALGFTHLWDSASGSTWTDEIGSADGTISGCTISTPGSSWPPNATSLLTADGVDDLVRVDHQSSVQPTDEVTICGWMFVDNLDTDEDWAGFITKGDNTYQLRRNFNNDPRVNLSWDVRGGTGGSVNASGDITHSLGTARFVVATYDGAEMRVMVNNDSDTMVTALTASRSGTIGSDSGSDLVFFAQDNSGTLRRYLAGQMALVALAPVGITLAQAQELYDAGFEEASAGVEGSVAQSLPALGQAVTADVAVTAELAQSLPALGQAAVAEVGTAVEGSIAQTLPALGQAATADTAVTGTLTQSLPALGQAATAVSGILGAPVDGPTHVTTTGQPTGLAALGRPTGVTARGNPTTLDPVGAGTNVRSVP